MQTESKKQKHASLDAITHALFLMLWYIQEYCNQRPGQTYLVTFVSRGHLFRADKVAKIACEGKFGQ